jgi:hypothetical protein
VEKIAQYCFCQILHKADPLAKGSEKYWLAVYYTKMPKISNSPYDQNSANLVTLDFYSLRERFPRRRGEVGRYVSGLPDGLFQNQKSQFG